MSRMIKTANNSGQWWTFSFLLQIFLKFQRASHSVKHYRSLTSAETHWLGNLSACFSDRSTKGPFPSCASWRGREPSEGWIPDACDARVTELLPTQQCGDSSLKSVPGVSLGHGGPFLRFLQTLSNLRRRKGTLPFHSFCLFLKCLEKLGLS